MTILNALIGPVTGLLDKFIEDKDTVGYIILTFDAEGNTIITAAGQLDPADCCIALERIKYQIINNEGEVNEFGAGVLSGLDLKVGGEGMKTFYNSIVPKVALAEPNRS